MSCSTQSAQPIRLTVTAGNLPEGYCPASYQQLFTDIATRLIVTPNQANTTFVTGSVEPTSNIGPWLKDCLQWFFFDDATGRYVIQTKGGFDSVQVFNTSGTFVVPDNIHKLKIEAWGGGGGGANNSGGGQGGGGGGGGGYGMDIITVIPSQAITVTVGSAGAGGAPGVAGGASTVLTLSAGGGSGGLTDSSGQGGVGGNGGVTTGADIPTNGESGGTSAGNAAANHGGEGGDSPQGGGGGTASPTAAQLIGVTPGGGGAGGTASLVTAGGSGAPGRVIIWY